MPLADSPLEITEKLGPPDVAFLPLAAGSVIPCIEQLLHIQLDHQRLTSSVHCTPEDAVEIHRTMNSRISVGIHWGTFATSRQVGETIRDLETSCRGAKVGFRGLDQIQEETCSEKGFAVVDIGRLLML